MEELRTISDSLECPKYSPRLIKQLTYGMESTVEPKLNKWIQVLKEQSNCRDEKSGIEISLKVLCQLKVFESTISQPINLLLPRNRSIVSLLIHHSRQETYCRLSFQLLNFRGHIRLYARKHPKSELFSGIQPNKPPPLLVDSPTSTVEHFIVYNTYPVMLQNYINR